MPRYTEITYTAEQMRDCRRRVSARDERIIALTAERDQLRAALENINNQPASAAKVACSMRLIARAALAHEERSGAAASTAGEGVKP